MTAGRSTGVPRFGGRLRVVSYVYGEKLKDANGRFIKGELVGYGVVIGLATFIAFSAAGRIARVLGSTGINVMTRLMGLILAAMAVELLADGLVKLFPILGAHVPN